MVVVDAGARALRAVARAEPLSPGAPMSENGSDVPRPSLSVAVASSHTVTGYCPQQG